MKGKNLSFWRKNLYYIIIAVCATAIVVMSTFAIINLNDKKGTDNPQIDQPDDPSGEDDPGKPVDTQIIFAMPVSNINVIKDYCDTVCWNSTLKQFSGHLAIDFGGTAEDKVFAVYDGTVLSNNTDPLNGTTIIIDHGSGLKTCYYSLAEAGTLKQGDTVKKGDCIGTMSASYGSEYSDGAHLHFEVIENNVKINPSKYLVFEEK
jgi:murein DD-endopeptidase MepM/ murein hydrolase activator NlpD